MAKISTKNISITLFIYFVHQLQRVIGLESAPQVECLESAMRLHFIPDGMANATSSDDNDSGNSTQQFCGHIYVKGFFFSGRCHLDFTRMVVDQPFYFHIPYRSDCQVKRERVSNQSIADLQPEQSATDYSSRVSGFMYSVIVIVQHHRLFVTERDRAYSVSCFYREGRHSFQNSIQVGDLAPAQVEGIDRLPTCAYEILSAASGQPTRYANIGDQLIHRWTCDTPDMGMLVHSCFVRDGAGSEFALLDERGCVTDESLIEPLTYSNSLNKSQTPPTGAFKFADQMIVYFTCQITLCERRENGCEGITPPTCNLTAPPPIPDADSQSHNSPMQLIGGRNGVFGNSPQFSSQFDSDNIHLRPDYSHQGSTAYHTLPNQQHYGSQSGNGYGRNSSLDVETPAPNALGSVSERWASETVNLFSRGRKYGSETEKTRNVRDTPSYYARTTTAWRDSSNPELMPRRRSADATQSDAKAKAKLTMDVAAERLIIFTNDEKISPNEKNGSGENESFSNAQKRATQNKCGNITVVWISGIFALLFVGTVCAFVSLHFRHRQQIATLQQQIQQQKHQQQPQGRLSTRNSQAQLRSYGSEESCFGPPPPFFELSTLYQGTNGGGRTISASRQNLVS